MYLKNVEFFTLSLALMTTVLFFQKSNKLSKKLNHKKVYVLILVLVLPPVNGFHVT